MFKHKTDYLILLFMIVMMVISLKWSGSLTDWWDALINGKQLNVVSIIYLCSLIGIVICVFLKYQGK
ncbi:MAG: hypothetical protein IJL85_06030 [Erysipelotrichaceae bacterium]|nr:hypothetical protein [Erysipelotrichaceae bacterium]